ncbi:MAG TPA: sugar ABC transporter permease [Eubacteriales bacterium]|nr:sugar ABC transporter permease [Eubacteriales bacterium]
MEKGDRKLKGFYKRAAAKLKAVPRGVAAAFERLFAFLKWAPLKVWLSIFVMGLGQLCYGQIIKGLIYLVSLGGMLWFFITKGFDYIIGFFTLGTVEENTWLGIKGDNSMNMLILGIFAFFILGFFIALWITNIKDAAYTARRVEKGEKPHSFKQTIQTATDSKFHVTALVLPLVSVCIFSVIPIVFMILIAFTNLGGDVIHPVLADWSFSAWQKIIGLSKVGSTFVKILRWNVLWAVTSTLLNFVCGLGLALLLNKRNVRFSKFWRAFPILAYAIPGFISMLGFKFMFSQSGPINFLLDQAGMQKIFFLTSDASAKWWARGIGLFVNAWISTPSIMLMTTGILSNINTDLYEAAALDGANHFQQFRKITLPFVVFATTPVLISQFVGNFNNFGIFFFMRSGVYSLYDNYFLASDTDLLINWLYNLSVSNNYYSIGAAISLIIFIITSAVSLLVYVNSAAYKQEDTYQ